MTCGDGRDLTTVFPPRTTVEGLAGADGELHPVQRAFASCDAFQCGYCAPGQVLSAVACIAEPATGGAPGTSGRVGMAPG